MQHGWWCRRLPADDGNRSFKTDVFGRVRISKEHREALLDAFENGGTSGLAFARTHGVNYQTFASWIQKRRRERDSYPVATGCPTDLLALNLAEVELPREIPPSPAASLESSGSPLTAYGSMTMSSIRSP